MTRKTLVIIGLVLLLLPAAARGQRRMSGGPTQQHKVELTPIIGWQFGGAFGFSQGEFKIPAALNYGVIIDIAVRPGAKVELLWNRQDSELKFDDRLTSLDSTLFDLSTQYFHIGGLYEVPKGKTLPFVGITLGATEWNPKESGIGSEWRFSAMGQLGTKIFPTKRVGLRLQGQLYFTFLTSSGGMFCGGGVCSVGLTGQVIAQGNVSAGLIIAL